MEQKNNSHGLIFDIGMHYGFDTRFYLDKGFAVVAVEADPRFVASGHKEFTSDIANGDLVIEPNALWHRDGDIVEFYINDIKDDWSSLFRASAEREGHECRQITVPTITLSTLFDRHGVPHYIKCDIEGADEIFAWQLLEEKRRPAFVSVEASSFELFAILRAAGYDRFQLINQAYHWATQPPNPAREGKYVPVRFKEHMSGLFGFELEKSAWQKLEVVADNFLCWKRLHARDAFLARGWLDLHATKAATLDAGGTS